MPHKDVESIQMEHSQSTNMEKLSMVINRWKESQSSPFTWETVIATIEGPRVNNRMKANEIRDYLSKGNNYMILSPQVVNILHKN